MLKFTSSMNIIRAGYASGPDGLLAVVCFMINLKSTYPTAYSFPNQVLSGTLQKKLDPEKLKRDPDISWSTKFPGFGILCKNVASTPELYIGPKDPSKGQSTFIVPGNLTPTQLVKVLNKINVVTLRNSVK